MAISLADNLKIQGKKQNVERDSFLTIEAMRSYNANYLPDIFTATCKETGKLYIYNVNNTVDATLGKWRVVESDMSNVILKTTTRTESAIDSTITAKHTHSNSELLSKLTENSDGQLAYNGTVVGNAESSVLNKDITSKITLGGIEYGALLAKGTEITDILSMLLNPNAVYPNIDISVSMSNGDTICYPGAYVKGTNLVGGAFTITPEITSSVNRTMHHVDFYYKLNKNANGTFAGRIFAEEVQSTSWIYYYTGLNMNESFTLYAIVYFVDDEDNVTFQEFNAPFTYVDPSYYGVVGTKTVNESVVKGLNKIALVKNEYDWENITAENQYVCYAYPTSKGKLVSIKDMNGYEYITSFTYTIVRVNSINYYVYLTNKPTTVSGYRFHFS